MTKVYDLFMFFNEIDLALIRMEILDPYVDYFVITESEVTFSGKPKRLNFKEHEYAFTKFGDKIIYNVVTDTPMQCDAWTREIHQRNAMKRSLLSVCKDEDIVITSDLDEIPDLSRMSQWYKEGELFHPLMTMYYYYLNVFKEDGWYGSKVCNWGYMKDIDIDTLRNMKSVGIKLWASGWHFSFLNPDNIIEKLGAFSHTEFDNDFYKSQVAKNVANNKDLFFRGGELQVVPIDDSFPPYIVNNQELLSKFIKKA